ncbi:hypothetical protein PT974_04443 [Cladobotryum mycophilum]|uniref:Uncharacterized protein n=1 Tax=Cladobotryum mycophilum TaxID=491253 RepID=A0ABR0SW76_9HYPO
MQRSSTLTSICSSDMSDVEIPPVSRCASPSFDDISEPAYPLVEPTSGTGYTPTLIVCEHFTEEPESYADEDDESIGSSYALSRWSCSDYGVPEFESYKPSADTESSFAKSSSESSVESSTESSEPSTPRSGSSNSSVQVTDDEEPLWGFLHTSSPFQKKKLPAGDFRPQYPFYLSTRPAQNGWGTSPVVAAPTSSFYTTEKRRETFYAKRSNSQFRIIKELTEKRKASKALEEEEEEDEPPRKKQEVEAQPSMKNWNWSMAFD